MRFHYRPGEVLFTAVWFYSVPPHPFPNRTTPPTPPAPHWLVQVQNADEMILVSKQKN